MCYDEGLIRDSTDFELFVGVYDDSYADKALGEQACLITVHKSVYSTLSETYVALVAWIEENGRMWNGATL